MDSVISQKITSAKNQGRTAFIPFVTGGFPDFASCAQLIRALDQAGSDVIEIGIPFSDPQADGPVIQASSQQALDRGVTPAGVLDMIQEVSGGAQAALVIMTYYNPVLQMGLEEFARRAGAVGVKGLIIPDLTPEEAGPWLAAAEKHGLDTIFLAAPTTTPERLEKILEFGGGFLYYVSMTGVTGADLSTDAEMLAGVERMRQVSNLPLAVGFGIARPDQAAALAPHADGVIVGSALVKKILQAKDKEAGVQAAAGLAGELQKALVMG